MAGVQEEEWRKAQAIDISVEVDLVSAVKKQLVFLAAVDRNRCLYEGPALQRAISRYEHCWLPLLSKHTESGSARFQLVAPLDCEWIWHCHRLNPIQYAKDCQKLYGRIIDASFVESSVKDSAMKLTEESWKQSYPEEPYELDLAGNFSENCVKAPSQSAQNIEYDLAEAVTRQSSFFYQVSRQYMSDDRFLKGAEERYKGFLYLIKKNRENSINCFCVPTYDIDLMWHSHQLQPVAYTRDMLKLLGKVLEHDDTDSDRSQGQKLDVGFTETTRQWENTYGRRYWRAGAMHRGIAPSPVPLAPVSLEKSGDIVQPLFQNDIKQWNNYLAQTEIVEVLLEAVNVKNIPEDHHGTLFVRYYKRRKSNDNSLVDAKEVQISSECKRKQVAIFRCEASGDLVFELTTRSSYTSEKSKCVLGQASLSLHTLLDSPTLSLEKWLILSTDKHPADSKPISLHLALSITPPIVAPYLLQAVRPHSFERKHQFLQFIWRNKQTEKVTRFFDHEKNEIFTIQMRRTEKPYVGSLEGSKEVVSGRRRIITLHQANTKPEKSQMLTTSGESVVEAEELISGGEMAQWSLMDNSCNLVLKNLNDIQKEPVFELRGNLGERLRLLSGRKLQYEVKSSRPEIEREFVTLVRYAPEAPYGQATALFNWKSLTVEAAEQESVLLVVLLSTIISAVMIKHGGANILSKSAKVNKKVCPAGTVARPVNFLNEATKIIQRSTRKGGNGGRAVGGVGLGVAAAGAPSAGGCGSGCGGGCGSGCGGGGGVFISSGACGGCGGGCGGSGGCGGCGGR